MTNYEITRENIIAKVCTEAGINVNEICSIRLFEETGLIGTIAETEWNIITCYIDPESGEAIGLMSENRSIEEFLYTKHIAKNAAHTMCAA